LALFLEQAMIHIENSEDEESLEIETAEDVLEKKLKAVLYIEQQSYIKLSGTDPLRSLVEKIFELGDVACAAIMSEVDYVLEYLKHYKPKASQHYTPQKQATQKRTTLGKRKSTQPVSCLDDSTTTNDDITLPTSKQRSNDLSLHTNTSLSDMQTKHNRIPDGNITYSQLYSSLAAISFPSQQLSVSIESVNSHTESLQQRYVYHVTDSNNQLIEHTFYSSTYDEQLLAKREKIMREHIIYNNISNTVIHLDTKNFIEMLAIGKDVDFKLEMFTVVYKDLESLFEMQKVIQFDWDIYLAV
jgi:hypothetical protein